MNLIPFPLLNPLSIPAASLQRHYALIRTPVLRLLNLPKGDADGTHIRLATAPAVASRFPRKIKTYRALQKFWLGGSLSTPVPSPPY